MENSPENSPNTEDEPINEKKRIPFPRVHEKINNHSKFVKAQIAFNISTQKRYDKFANIVEYRIKKGKAKNVRDVLTQMIDYCTSDEYLYGEFKQS